MAELIKINDFRTGYIDLVRKISLEGRYVSPRGIATREIPDLTVELAKPADSIPAGIGRSLVPAIGIVESLHLMAGVSALSQLDGATKGGFSKYSDDGKTLHGAYGPRTYHGVIDAVRRIGKDPDTRQAVVSVWNRTEPGSKDLPCTLSFVFSLRNGKLDMTTHMRSNDVWLGSPYDFWMFTNLQHLVAFALHVPVGVYVHHAVSWHLYDHDLNKIELQWPTVEALTTPPIPMFTDDLKTDATDFVDRLFFARREVIAAIEGKTTVDAASVKWYADRTPALGDQLFNSVSRYYTPAYKY